MDSAGVLIRGACRGGYGLAHGPSFPRPSRGVGEIGVHRTSGRYVEELPSSRPGGIVRTGQWGEWGQRPNGTTEAGERELRVSMPVHADNGSAVQVVLRMAFQVFYVRVCSEERLHLCKLEGRYD